MKALFLVLALFASTAYAQLVSTDSSKAGQWQMSSRINMAKGVAIPSAPTVDLNSVAGNFVHVTGVSTISSFGTASQAGIQRRVIFDSALTITYNASTLIVPGASSLSIKANDNIIVVADTLTNWIVLDVVRAATIP